ncbi:DUF1648 domain-containing protein [Gorillibacterium sp. CAU 1737]|uniref:DUF1648 domain-containing protein n=1 Tax=Gorillibacterium sp. CAU 1737 TaxID=3140362 RepID=UPI003260394F
MNQGLKKTRHSREGEAVPRTKRTRRFQRINWLIGALPLLLLAILYPSMPDQVPVHFNGSMAADGYADKASISTLLIGLLGFLGPLLMKPIGYFRRQSEHKGQSDSSPSADMTALDIATLGVTLVFSGMAIYFLVLMVV